MVSVVTLDDHGLPIRCLWQQAHSVPEIPAAGALAEVAADGSHVPDLRTGGIGDGFGKGRIVLPDVRASTIRSRVTKAPMRAPPSRSVLIASRPETCLILTTRLGVRAKSFMRPRRSVPPAKTSVSPQFGESKPSACFTEFGLTYSN